MAGRVLLLLHSKLLCVDIILLYSRFRFLLSRQSRGRALSFSAFFNTKRVDKGTATKNLVATSGGGFERRGVCVSGSC